jgi:hypothetical protein
MEETGVAPTGNGRAAPRLASGATPRSWLSPQDVRMRGGLRKRIRAHPRSGGRWNQHGGNGRGDTVRLPARASSGGVSVAGKRRSSLGRGRQRPAVEAAGAETQRTPVGSRLQYACALVHRTGSGLDPGPCAEKTVEVVRNHEGGTCLELALAGARGRSGGRVTGRRGSGRAEAGRQSGNIPADAPEARSDPRRRKASRAASTGRSRAREVCKTRRHGSAGNR